MGISKEWRLQTARYRLIGSICSEGHKSFPPREICPHCAEEAKTLYQYARVFAKLASGKISEIRVSSKAQDGK